MALVMHGWDFDRAYRPASLARAMGRAYTRENLAESDFRVVVEHESQVVGFLFGNSGAAPTWQRRVDSFSADLRARLRLRMLTGVPASRRREIAERIALHRYNREQVEPNGGAEINLFVVSSGSQGKGYGKGLFHAFYESCRASGVPAMVVETDDTSAVTFYEAQGFARAATFHSPIQELYANGAGDTYIYRLPMAETRNA